MNERIKRARAGDAEAFVALMEAHKQSLYKIARSYLSSPMDAEDAVSETVLDCWAALATLKKPAYFKTWLTRILINNCKDILRRGSRLVVTDEPPERDHAENDHSGLYFEALMGLLSETLRPVMQLYYGEGFSVREISDLLDIPAGTVTVRLKRGREQLEKALREEEGQWTT